MVLAFVPPDFSRTQFSRYLIVHYLFDSGLPLLDVNVCVCVLRRMQHFNYHMSRGGSPSIRNLRDTEVCFLHIQLMGTNVRLPKIHKISTEVDLESSRSPAKPESWNRPNRPMLSRVSHMAILSMIICVMNVCYQTSQASVTGSCPFCDCSCKFVHRPKNVKSTNSCQTQAF